MKHCLVYQVANVAKKVKGIWIVMKRKTEKRERGWAKQNILTL